MILKLAFSILILISSINCQDNVKLSKIKLKDNLFVDKNGRIKLFHGENYVNKGFPWYLKI